MTSSWRRSRPVRLYFVAHASVLFLLTSQSSRGLRTAFVRALSLYQSLSEFRQSFGGKSFTLRSRLDKSIELLDSLLHAASSSSLERSLFASLRLSIMMDSSFVSKVIRSTCIFRPSTSPANHAILDVYLAGLFRFSFSRRKNSSLSSFSRAVVGVPARSRSILESGLDEVGVSAPFRCSPRSEGVAGRGANLCLEVGNQSLELGRGQFLIDLGFVFDRFCSHTKAEGRDGFGIVDTSEFRITIGDVRRFAVSQGVDDHAQSTQRLVDLLCFFKRLTAGSCLSNLFRTSQIDQEQLTRLDTSSFDVLLANGDDEDGDLVDLIDTADVDFHETFDIDTAVLFLVNGQVVVLRDEQIADAFHVDFHVADPHCILDVALTGHDGSENLLSNARNDTLVVRAANV
ncbi:kinesin, partial [Aureobasidium melanogenum]